MFKRFFTIMQVIALCCMAAYASAQNWLLTIQDPTQGTPIDQVNGIAGSSAVLYGVIENFTGTNVSDDGTGNPAPATLLDFGGFGFTQYPGQSDLGSRFVPDPRIPGYPQVSGSLDGVNAGDSGVVSLGSFDLSGLATGTYQEDFTATAFPDDFASTVVFADITGTLTLDVSSASTPEPSGAVVGIALCILVVVRLKRRKYAGSRHPWPIANPSHWKRVEGEARVQ